jgi:hypothetical protein
MSAKQEFRVNVAGHTMPKLHFSAGPSWCGNIRNGVSLGHVRADGSSEGGWVISYRDLMRMAKAATEARAIKRVRADAAHSCRERKR